VFSRKVIFRLRDAGRGPVSIGAVDEHVGHHMFHRRMGGTLNSFFAASTMLVGVRPE